MATKPKSLDNDPEDTVNKDISYIPPKDEGQKSHASWSDDNAHN